MSSTRRLALCAFGLAGFGGMVAMTIESFLDRMAGVAARDARLAIMAIFAAILVVSIKLVMNLDDREWRSTMDKTSR